MSLSVIVITKNEEENIAPCLESVRWADEIIVVDANSEDRTVEIARRYSERVFARPWGGYGPQKNFAIERAQCEWILIVDADERVSDELKGEILLSISRAGPEGPSGFEIPRRNFFYGAWVSGGGLFPDYQLRLFRRGAGQYDDTLVHERLELQGTIDKLCAPLDHHSMPRVTTHVRKIMIYTTLAAQEKLKCRSTISWTDIGVHHLGTMLKSYVVRRGYRDGVRGLIVALFAGMYTFVKYAKAWEQLAARAPR